METINFPEYYSDLHVKIAISGLLGLVVTISVIIGWKNRLTKWKNRKSDHEIEQLSTRFITKTIVGPIFLFTGTFIPIMNIYEKSEYRNLMVDEVSALKIYRIDDQGRTLFINPRYITDKAITASGLSKMKECTITSKEKGYTLSDGYLIEMYSEDEEYIREFNVYKKTFRIADGSILRINESYLTLKGSSLYDIYSCPSLHNWVNEHIDPLFINETTK